MDITSHVSCYRITIRQQNAFHMQMACVLQLSSFLLFSKAGLHHLSLVFTCGISTIGNYTELISLTYPLSSYLDPGI